MCTYRNSQQFAGKVLELIGEFDECKLKKQKSVVFL